MVFRASQAQGKTHMNEWKYGLVIAPTMIVAMALLLRHKRAISGTTLVLSTSAAVIITALLFSM